MGDLGTTSTPLRGASSTEGFFQRPPKLVNQFIEDAAFRRAFEAFLPADIRTSIEDEFKTFADLVLTPKVFADIADAERNLPYVKTWDMWGNRVDEVVLSNGWNNLVALAYRAGFVSTAHTKPYGRFSRPVQFLKMNLWSGSCAATGYNITFADGACVLLNKFISHAEEPLSTILKASYEHLVSTDPETAWTSGLFMTERSGGSDVSGTETVAYLRPENEREAGKDASGFELGPWEIDGFKWFSSGTESMMTMLLAKTTKGISLFYAPMRRQITDEFGDTTTRLNGVRIQRLKNKLGTRANTTAELELKGMRAWLIGEEGNGIKQVTQVLSVTRLHIAINCLGNWARGLAASRAYSKVRKVARGTLLKDVPLHMAVLAREHVKYRGIWMLLNFASLLLGASENFSSTHQTSKEPFELLPERPEDVLLLLRVLTSPIKGVSARAAIHGLLECIEFLGGVGYLENEQMDFNIARMYRDVSMGSIIDGTTNMQSSDLINVVSGSLGAAVMDCLNRWIHRVLPEAFDALQPVIDNLQSQWSSLQQTIKESDKATLMVNANEIMEDLTAIVSGVILVADAARDHDKTAIAVARSWMEISFTAKSQRREPGSLEQLKVNQAIVFGEI